MTGARPPRQVLTAPARAAHAQRLAAALRNRLDAATTMSANDSSGLSAAIAETERRHGLPRHVIAGLLEVDRTLAGIATADQPNVIEGVGARLRQGIEAAGGDLRAAVEMLPTTDGNRYADRVFTAAARQPHRRPADDGEALDLSAYVARASEANDA